MFAGIPNPETHADWTPVPITATSAVLLDGSTNQFLYAKNMNVRRAPASTTKILTSLVALERLDLNAVVRVPKFAELIEPSKINLQEGELYYVRDLIRATLINSANDAAEVLAVAAAGTKQDFAVLMNQKARQLGCGRSHFVRASGLPAANQYSTAYDMALIMRAAEQVPFISSTMRVKTMTISSLGGRQIFLKNHNKLLLKGYNQIIGKTGWTRLAKHCFVGQITSANRTAVVAMLGSHALWRDLQTLIRYQFGLRFVKPKQVVSVTAITDTRKIQAALRKAGYYNGPITGNYGPLTKGAVRKFQRANGLRPDGMTGPVTLQALKRYF